MKLKLVAGLCVLMLYACSSSNQDENLERNKLSNNTSSNSSTEISKEVQVGGGRFQVHSELANNVKIYAYETNQLKDGVYYLLIALKNDSSKPFRLQMEQMILVDQYGNEHNVGLADYELLNTIEPHATVMGIVGFEGGNDFTPAYLIVRKLG